jgi:Na+/proline symporter
MVHANSFTWADYAVFALMLSICLTIGVVFGIVNRKKKSSGDFLLGGGDLHVVPVGFSILASFISAIAILGYSGEMYRYGTMYYLIVISHIIVHCLVALIYIPFYHQLDITTAYQVN